MFLLPKKILTKALHEIIVIPITNHILFPLVPEYGVLPLAGWQVAAKAALSLLSSAGHMTENIMKDLWIEIRMGRDQLSVTVMDRTDLIWANQFNLLSIQ